MIVIIAKKIYVKIATIKNLGNNNEEFVLMKIAVAIYVQVASHSLHLLKTGCARIVMLGEFVIFNKIKIDPYTNFQM